MVLESCIDRANSRALSDVPFMHVPCPHRHMRRNLCLYWWICDGLSVCPCVNTCTMLFSYTLVFWSFNKHILSPVARRAVVIGVVWGISLLLFGFRSTIWRRMKGWGHMPHIWVLSIALRLQIHTPSMSRTHHRCSLALSEQGCRTPGGVIRACE